MLKLKLFMAGGYDDVVEVIDQLEDAKKIMEHIIELGENPRLTIQEKNGGEEFDVKIEY